MPEADDCEGARRNAAPPQDLDRTLIDAAPAILWATDGDHQCTFLSRGWSDHTGQSEAEALGAGWLDAVHPDDRDRTSRTFLQAAERREPFQLEYRLRQADGSHRWVLDAGRPRLTSDGALLGYVGSVIDIDDRKRSEEQAHRTQTLLEGLARQSGDLIAVEDHDFRYLFFNDAYRREFERLWGKTIEVGTSMAEALAPWPDQQKNARSLWGRALAGESFTVTEEFGPSADERQVYDLHFSPIRDGQGEIVGASHILRNVTDRVRTEETLRRLAAELAESDRRKDEFLATLSHELRNPLAPIRTGLEVMAMAIDEGDTDAVENARRIIERQTSHLVNLVDDLLNASRLSRGKIELQTERVILEDVIDRAVETSRPLFGDKQHELTLSFHEQPTYVGGDPTRLVQIFGNILHNAAKYTPPGGHITVGTERVDGGVAVHVKDDGIGLAPEMLESVFDMFVQVGRSGSRAQTGLGIGLTLARSLVEMHGGHIRAHSDGAGQGTEMRVWLPLSRAEDATAPHGGPHADGSSEDTRRVLVVDDNRDAAHMLRSVIQRLGNEAHTAHDGHQALEVAARVRPDMVLMDLGMPTMDGYEAARRMRGEPWGKDLTLVALTGWGQEEDRRRSREAGFDRHLVKPASTEKLRQLFEDVASKEG